MSTQGTREMGEIRLEGFTTGGQTVDEGVRKLVFTAETAADESVSEWGWDNFTESL